MKLRELAVAEVRARMANAGLVLMVPPITFRVRSTLPFLADQIHFLYADQVFADAREFADIDIKMIRLAGGSPLVQPKVQFVVDGTTPFDAFPLAHTLPMFEWGLNWVFAHRMHGYLLLHAAVVERDGLALVMPAWPGSGKSTLAASLACRGWRFLSDEFGVVQFGGERVLPFARPASLKNASIDVMRAFAADAAIGEVFANTHKGTVAHFRVPAESAARGGEPAAIAAIVFPEFKSGADVTVRELPRATAMLKLAGNAFNYEVVGERGFRSVSAIVRRCESCVLQYGDLAGAHAALDEIVARASRP